MENQHELIVGVTPETANVDTPLRNNPSATDLLETAFFIRGKGYNVLPIYGKKPIIEKWEHLKNSRQSLHEIEGYDWKRATGLAVVFGVNSIHSLDIDDVKDESVLTDLMSRLGLPADYEWVERTGGGFQIFFLNMQDQNPIEDKSYVSGDCVDDRCGHFELRWKNCYSVVPPSQHFDKIANTFDGKSYSWMRGDPHGNPMEIPINVVMDTWRQFTKIKDVPSAKPADPPVAVNNSPEIEEAIQKFDMRRFLSAQQIPFREENDAQHQLRIEYAKGHNSLLWSDDKRCSNWMREGKGGGLFETLSFLVYGNYDFSKLDGPDKHNVFEILSHFSGVHIPPPQKKDAPENPTTDIRGRKLWDKDELMNASFPDLVEIVEGVLSDEAVYMLAGQDKAGKSILGMNLALSIASDRDMFLNWKIKKHGPVVYFNNELSDRQIHRRLRQMNIPTTHPVKFMNDKDLRFDENIDEILAICREHSPVLVIVDCHYRTTAQDKDVGNKIQKVLENYPRIKEEMKCCVFVIHHTRKSAVGQRADSSQAMGSHTFAMMTDGNLQMKRSDTEPEKRILFETGSRDFWGFKPRLLQLNELSLWFRDLGECNEEEHTQEINRMRKKIVDYPVKVLEAMPGNQLMKYALVENTMSQFGIRQAMAYRSIKKALDEGKIAESERGVVTLVKADQELVVRVEEAIPGPLELEVDTDSEEG